MSNALRIGRAIEIKRGDVDKTGTFAGYASTFDRTADRVGDIVAPGAFSKTLKLHHDTGSTPGMLWSHDFMQPIGKWQAMTEDARGLKVQGRLTMALQRAKDAHALMQDDALSLSIGYRVRADGVEGRNRILKDLELLEVSLVAVAANPRAQITSVKDLRGPADLQRALQELLAAPNAKRKESQPAAGLRSRGRNPLNSLRL